MILARPFHVRDASETAPARRAAATAARELGLDEHDAARAALVVTEAATNLVRHTDGGEILLLPLAAEDGPRLQILALDSGPGFSMTLARRDGYSTAGSPGTGLGAMARASDLFSVYSRPGAGTVLLSEIRTRGATRRARAPLTVGGFSLPKPGEQVCGDAWSVAVDSRGVSILLVDGLGHGEGAAEASRAAVSKFSADPHLAPARQLTGLHDALRPTRGAAAAVARVDALRGLVQFAGVGNTIGLIDADSGARHMVSHNGTVGHGMSRLQEFTYPFPSGALLVMATDGLNTRLSLTAYPGLATYPPALVAAVLYRDFRRGRDDATIIVVAGNEGREPDER